MRHDLQEDPYSVCYSLDTAVINLTTATNAVVMASTTA